LCADEDVEDTENAQEHVKWLKKCKTADGVAGRGRGDTGPTEAALERKSRMYGFSCNGSDSAPDASGGEMRTVRGKEAGSGVGVQRAQGRAQTRAMHASSGASGEA
jgi:hypothetical protein